MTELTEDGTEEGEWDLVGGESNSKLWSQGLRKDRAEVHSLEMRRRGQAS